MRENKNILIYGMIVGFILGVVSGIFTPGLAMNMKGVEDAGADEKTADFILPLGSTVNMDGTALYEGVAVVFICQAYGIPLGPVAYFTIFITAILAGVGAAAIPQAGLVAMVVVLKSVGAPIEGIGLLLAVDWLMDRFRTTTNVWGDAVGVMVVERILYQQKKML